MNTCTRAPMSGQECTGVPRSWCRGTSLITRSPMSGQEWSRFYPIHGSCRGTLKTRALCALGSAVQLGFCVREERARKKEGDSERARRPSTHSCCGRGGGVLSARGRGDCIRHTRLQDACLKRTRAPTHSSPSRELPRDPQKSQRYLAHKKHPPHRTLQKDYT